VKIDIEGSETAAMPGMEKLFGDPAGPPVLFESNGHTLQKAGTSPSALMAEFERFGYQVYMVDPGLLTRIGSADMQPQTVVDCLAIKRRPPGLDGWRIVSSFTFDDCVGRIVAESRHPNPDCRVWIARSLAAAGEEVLSHPDVAASLDLLRGDRLPEVRAAAAWSAGGRPAQDQAGAEVP
jgi:hypothetical protein